MYIKEKYTKELRAEIEEFKEIQKANMEKPVLLKRDEFFWKDEEGKVVDLDYKAINAAKMTKMFGNTECRLVCNLEKEYVYPGTLDYGDMYVDGDIYVEKLHFISKIGDEWFKSKELEEIALDRKYLK